MKKKAIKFGTVGFLIGCFVYLLFSIVVSLLMNTGDFYFALPALINNYNNELFAVIAQIVTFTWFGLACGIAYLFCEDVDLTSKTSSRLFNFINCWVLPLAWTGQWFEHIFIGIFSYIIIVAVVSASFIFDWISEIEMRC